MHGQIYEKIEGHIRHINAAYRRAESALAEADPVYGSPLFQQRQHLIESSEAALRRKEEEKIREFEDQTAIEAERRKREQTEKMKLLQLRQETDMNFWTVRQFGKACLPRLAHDHSDEADSGGASLFFKVRFDGDSRQLQEAALIADALFSSVLWLPVELSKATTVKKHARGAQPWEYTYRRKPVIVRAPSYPFFIIGFNQRSPFYGSILGYNALAKGGQSPHYHRPNNSGTSWVDPKRDIVRVDLPYTSWLKVKERFIRHSPASSKVGPAKIKTMLNSDNDALLIGPRDRDSMTIGNNPLFDYPQQQTTSRIIENFPMSARLAYRLDWYLGLLAIRFKCVEELDSIMKGYRPRTV